VVDEMIKRLLEAGVHFGHQRKRWNPKMARYIFGEKNGIYIIDLEKTAEKLKEACEFLKNTASNGGRILFVGTKKQAQETIRSSAERCGMFYVDRRWLGGMMTNFATIKKSVARYSEIQKIKETGVVDNLKKKEISQLTKEASKLEKSLGGVLEMKRLPDALFIIDVKNEDLAVKEAKKLSIPMVAVIDTNSDPDPIDYPIPANDDALKSIELMALLISDAILEGVNIYKKAENAAKKEKEAKDAEEAKGKGDVKAQ